MRRRKEVPQAPREARVEALSHEGRGIARLDGKATFIDGALPGELVRFRYTARRGRHDAGSVIEVLEPAAERVTPRCRHFGICGGCSLQHLDEAAQRALKQRSLLEQLAHVGGVQPERVLPPVMGPGWGYRHKARLMVKMVEKKGGLLLGFSERGSRLVTDLSRCETLHPLIGESLPALKATIAGLSVAARIPQVEVAVGENGAALVLRHLEPLSEEDRTMLGRYAEGQGLQMYAQPGGPETVTPIWPLVPEPLFYSLLEGRLRLEFLPLDFTQVNPAVNRAMVSQVLDLLAPAPGDRVLDLFCGLGNFTLPIALAATEVLGVEGDAALIERARANALRNGISNALFDHANLAGPALDAPWLGQPWDKLLLDPPRSGADQVLERLPLKATHRVVYVSCNPATLARDARILADRHGMRLRAAGILDMFPHTSHVESIALFER
jgi:23S rRNA (uracil1939-C5)-methyltransferase